MPASSFQQQKLRVCEVCSAYLGLHDNDRRLADHFGGKLHLGFIQIREKLDQLRVMLSVLNLLRVVLKTLNTSVKSIQQNSLQSTCKSPEISACRICETPSEGLCSFIIGSVLQFLGNRIRALRISQTRTLLSFIP